MLRRLAWLLAVLPLVVLALVFLLVGGGSANKPPAISAGLRPGYPLRVGTSPGPAPGGPGAPVAGETLITTNGTWGNKPTSFTYLWEDCDTSGNNCVAAAGSPNTTKAYVVVDGDIGHTLRVVVTAHNAQGQAQQTSAQTGVVSSGGTYAGCNVGVNYPVNPTSETANGGMGVNNERVTPITTGGAGQITSIAVYLAPTGTVGTENMRAVVYADAAGVPGALLGGGAGNLSNELSFTNATAGGWYTFTFANPITVAAATQYWVGLFTGGTADVAQFYYNVTGALHLSGSVTYGGVPLDPFGTPNSLVQQPAICAQVGTGTFPLSVSSNGRYLKGAGGQPFMIVGDGPQGMIPNLGNTNPSNMPAQATTDANTYFNARKAQGFNTTLIDAVSDSYTGGPFTEGTANYGHTVDNINPFTSTLGGGYYNLTAPTAAYWARVAQVVSIAKADGFEVFLDPMDTGGWQATINANCSGCTGTSYNTSNAYKYGQFLGCTSTTYSPTCSTLGSYGNIIWANGNDFGSPLPTGNNDVTVQAIAEGIKNAAQAGGVTELQTVEFNELSAPVTSLSDPCTGPSSSPPCIQSWQSLIGIDGTYVYPGSRVYASSLTDYAKTGTNLPMPIFLIEGFYEGRSDGGGTQLLLRQQAYQTLLAGGNAGQFYGEEHVTFFCASTASSCGNTSVQPWQNHLNDPGAADEINLVNLFSPQQWQSLVPDTNTSHTLVTSGYGTYGAADYTTSARTPDGTLGFVYESSGAAPTVSLAGFVGPVTARWYDPTNGTFRAITGSPFANSGTRSFSTPGNNSTGDPDWILLLEASGSSGVPVNLTLPTASGTTQSGQTLTATAGTWTNTPTEYDYTWQRCTGSAGTGCSSTGTTCADTGGTLNSGCNYLLTSSDVNDYMNVVVTAKNGSGASTPATSTATGQVTSGGPFVSCFSAPGACGYPDPVGANDPGGVPNVGVPSGTSLTSHSGDVTVTGSGCSICTGAGTYINPYVIDGYDISGTDSGSGSGVVTVSTDNVIIRNTRITDTSSPGPCAVYATVCTNADIYVSGADHVWVTNSELTATSGAYVQHAIRNTFGGTVYVDHVYQHGNTDAICQCASSPSTFNDNYSTVHAAIAGDHVENTYGNDVPASLPLAQAGGPGIPGLSLTWNHNTFYNPDASTANLFVEAAGGSNPTGAQCINRTTISNNLFAGGGFTFYLCANSASANSAGSGNPGAGAVVANNHIARCATSQVSGSGGTWLCSGGSDTFGYYPRGGSFGIVAGSGNSAFSLCGVNGSVWYGNTWDNDGSAISGSYGACATTTVTDCFIAPGACGYPDPNYNNVGVSPEIPLTQSGSLTISSPGTYQNLAVTGSITVNSSNVTIKNSKVWTTSSGCDPAGNACGNAEVYVQCNCSNVVLSHVELGSAANQPVENAVRTLGNPNQVTISYAYQHGDTDSLCQCDNGSIDHTYSVTTFGFALDHLENVQTESPPYTLNIDHVTFLNPWPQTTTVFGQTGFSPTNPACAQHITITNSLLGGGGGLLELCANSSTAGSAVTNLQNDRFIRCNHGQNEVQSGGEWHCPNGADEWGYYPRGGSLYFDAYMFTCGGQNGSQWVNNVWDDNNTAAAC
jgi:Protein of unknown function (DUF4038)/Putative collagen-binding domain of a collagenase